MEQEDGAVKGRPRATVVERWGEWDGLGLLRQLGVGGG
jgi:hypothetical protein